MPADAHLPQFTGAVAADGWPIHESLRVPWMQPLQLPHAGLLIAREAADVPARIGWEQVKAGMRADLERALDEMAARVGVDR